MKKLTVLILLLCLVMIGTQAQDDETSPLRQLLSGVPLSQATNPMSLIGYVDYQGIDKAREGVPVIDDVADLSTLSSDDTRLWLSNRNRMITGLDLSSAFLDAETTQELLGFSIIDMTHALIFDQPPQFATMVLIDKPFGVIRSAFLARDYQRLDENGVEFLCYEGDCTNGLEVSVADREPANIFGGNLGRKEVFALFEDDQLLLNSPEDSQVQAMASTYSGQSPSILDVPTYATMVDALLNHEGDLLQTVFISPVNMFYADMGLTEDMITLPDDVGELPLYAIANITDYQIGDEQVASLAVLVDSEENARIAIDEIQKRMAVHPLYISASENFDISVNTSTYVDPDGNGVVAFVDYHYLLPPTEADITIGMGTGILVRNFINALYRVDLTPLMLGLGSESE